MQKNTNINIEAKIAVKPMADDPTSEPIAEPEAYLTSEYIDFIDREYTNRIAMLAYQYIQSKIPLEEYGRATVEAARGYNERISNLISNLSELELIEYDAQNPEEVARAELIIQRRLKEELAELRDKEKKEKNRRLAQSRAEVNERLRKEIESIKSKHDTPSAKRK